MQVEHVAGVRFASRRATQQQGDLAVGPCLFCQIVIDDERILTAIPEVLAHRASGIWRDVLYRCRLRRSGSHDDGVGHGPIFFELAHDVGDRRCFLSNGYVDAEEILALLVDDRIDGHSGLAGLPIADDELALSAADRHHGIDCLQAGLHGLRNRLAPDDARCDLFDDVAGFRIDRTLAVDRLSQCIDHTAEQLRADRHLQNAARGLDDVAFGDVLIIAEHHRAYGIELEIQRKAEGVARKLQHLALHHIRQAVNPADAIGHGYHRTLRAHLGRNRQILDLVADQLADLRRIQLLHRSLLFTILFALAHQLAKVEAMLSSWPRTDASHTSSSTWIFPPPISVGTMETLGSILRPVRFSSFATSA